MIRTQVYLPDDLFHQAKARATVLNTSISQLIREGLLFTLKKQTNQTTGQFLLDQFVGRGQGKVGVEAALNHDDIYDLKK